MNILKLNSVIKHVLVAVLFFSFSAFTSTQPQHNHQSSSPLFNEIQVIVHANGAIELEMENTTKALDILPQNEVPKKEPLPKTNIIVDDVMVMLQDAATERDGFAAISSHHSTTTIKFPFPG